MSHEGVLLDSGITVELPDDDYYSSSAPPLAGGGLLDTFNNILAYAGQRKIDDLYRQDLSKGLGQRGGVYTLGQPSRPALTAGVSQNQMLLAAALLGVVLLLLVRH